MRKKENPQQQSAVEEQEKLPEVSERFWEFQIIKAKNETQELRLREKELDLSSKQGNKIIDYQAKLLQSHPTEHRKTISLYLNYLLAFVSIFIVFLDICLYFEKEDFAWKFLQVSGYVLTTGLGYYFGRRSIKIKKEDEKYSSSDIEDAEIVR